MNSYGTGNELKFARMCDQKQMGYNFTPTDLKILSRVDKLTKAGKYLTPHEQAQLNCIQEKKLAFERIQTIKTLMQKET